VARPGRILAGLTGGLACGKSTVLARLRELGAGTVDDDAIARRALDPGSPLLERVAAALGRDLLDPDGRLDRARLAERVFADAGRRRELEAIVHPEVVRREREESERLLAAGYVVVVCDVPLLYETGGEERFDRVIVVACGPETQLQRAVARGMTEADARARIAAQMPLEEKARRADLVIDSGGTLTETLAAAERVYALLLAAARGSGPA
jgi:dephospho-CoA kinase